MMKQAFVFNRLFKAESSPGSLHVFKAGCAAVARSVS